MGKIKVFLLLFICQILVNVFATAQNNKIKIPFTTSGSGLIYVKVVVNKNYTKSFIFDTGASGISINNTLFNTMLNAKAITKKEIIDTTTVIIADGSHVLAKVINLKSISIGGFEMNNILAFVMPDANAPLLIGQNIFNKFGKITLDYNNKEIEFEKNMNSTQNTNLSINELKFIPCDSNKIKEVSPLKTILKNGIAIKNVSIETNVPPPQKAVSRINTGITIRYFENNDYLTAIKLKEILANNNNYKNYKVQIENMLPYFNYESIPSYIEIWIK